MKARRSESKGGRRGRASIETVGSAERSNVTRTENVKPLRNGVHRANAVVWGPVIRRA